MASERRGRGNLTAEPVTTTVTSEIEARSEVMPQITLSVDIPVPEVEAVSENKYPKTEITTKEKTEPAPPAKPTPHAISKSSPASTEPKSGDRAVIDGNAY